MIEKLRAHWRKELLYLGLAAMETCWFYPWLAFLLGRGHRIPLAATVGMLLLAMYVTRVLHQRAAPLLRQRIVTVLLALLSSLLLLRLYVYVDYSISDLSWLGHFVWEVGEILQRISPALIVFFASLYLWGRGISLAQRSLGVESVGFSFRVGIIAFLWLFLVKILGSTVEEAIPFTFAYFFLGLVVVGLARIESVSQSHLGVRSPFNASWMGILAGSTLVVSAVSVGVTALLSLRNIAAIINRGHPIIVFLGRLASPLLAAMAWLLQLLITSLIRIFSGLFGAESQEASPLARIAEQIQEFQQAQPVQGALRLILQLVKWEFLGAVLLGVLAMLAFSISRVRRALETETVKRESVWDRGSAGNDVQGAKQSRWQRLRDELQARLARLRGEDYSLVSVRQIYASLVRLATASGFPRREAETPYEYTATLRRAFAGSEPEIQLITEAYVRVHYGERSFSSQYVQRVRDAWLAIHARQEQQSSQA